MNFENNSVTKNNGEYTEEEYNSTEQCSTSDGGKISKQELLEEMLMKTLSKDDPFEGINKLSLKDRYLPLANISKIMKDGLPEDGTKVSKKAKELLQQCASEFIALISCKTKETVDFEIRKTVTAEDLLNSMDELDLACYSEISAKFLTEYVNLLKNNSSNIEKYKK